jgi:hypothetical protein
MTNKDRPHPETPIADGAEGLERAKDLLGKLMKVPKDAVVKPQRRKQKRRPSH